MAGVLRPAFAGCFTALREAFEAAVTCVSRRDLVLRGLEDRDGLCLLRRVLERRRGGASRGRRRVEPIVMWRPVERVVRQQVRFSS